MRRTSHEVSSHTGPAMPVLRIDTKIPSVDHGVQVPCDHTVEVSVSLYNLQSIPEKKIND